MPLERRPRSLLARIPNAEFRELMAAPPLTIDRDPPLVLLRWCTVCVGWMREGSAAIGRCVDCGTSRIP